MRRSQWTRDLRRRSTAARLLRWWVRIPPGAGIFVCCVCCQVEVSATSWSLVQRSPTDFGASVCVITKPSERGGYSTRWAAEPDKKKRNGFSVYTTDQQMHYSDNLIIHSKAPTFFDVCTSSSGSLLLCVLLSYIKMCIVVVYGKSLYIRRIYLIKL
jgi:hypothetical protein